MPYIGEAPDLIPDVDDSDDLDPESEFQAWRLRELSRLTRDKERTFAMEEERIEIERRRALPAAQRDAEDEEYARKTREEAKEGRGDRAFLEKYWHKGAFHQVSVGESRLVGRKEGADRGS
jgi:microfibrillar-associated protein 1